MTKFSSNRPVKSTLTADQSLVKQAINKIVSRAGFEIGQQPVTQSVCLSVTYTQARSMYLNPFQVDKLHVALMQVQELAISFFISELHKV